MSISSTVNSFGAKFQTTFIVCFVFVLFFFNKLSTVKLKDRMSNSIDPDETAHYELSHLDLCCLQKPIIIAYGSTGVNDYILVYTILQIITISFLGSVLLKRFFVRHTLFYKYTYTFVVFKVVHYFCLS